MLHLQFRLTYSMINCFYTVSHSGALFYINRTHFEDNIYVGIAKVSISLKQNRSADSNGKKLHEMYDSELISRTTNFANRRPWQRSSIVQLLRK